MVKNQYGGSGAKGLARKDEKGYQNRKLRMPESQYELFAIVRKIYGGDSCEIICDDKIVRRGIIRGKFSGGKGKRQNLITSSTLVLVGIRDWATVKEGKIESCDILEVYSSIEVEQLKTNPKFPIDFMINALRDTFGASARESNIDEFIFSSSIEKIEEEKKKEETNTEEFTIGDNAICIDDI